MPPSTPGGAAGTRGTPDGTPSDRVRDIGALRPRDRAVVLAVARMRILAYEQLARLVFPHRHVSIVSRRVRALERAGWVVRARPVVAAGGAPTYVVPTRAGLAHALRVLEADASAAPHGNLVARMLPARARMPLRPIGRVAPSFLTHQREVNQLLVAYSTCPALKVWWASSWERPFGRSADAFVLPQPDYVLVLERASRPLLVFGEHDRGQESLAHFRRTKAERYAAFALLPTLARELFGIGHVEVWVTVTDPVSAQPRRRLTHLAAVLAAAGAAPICRLALAGRAFAAPVDTATWCRAESAMSRAGSGVGPMAQGGRLDSSLGVHTNGSTQRTS